MTIARDLAELLRERGVELSAERKAEVEGAARELLDSNIAMRSLQVGEQVADFELSSGAGERVRLSERLRRGAAVLTFYRGEWCSYCRSHLVSLERAADRIRQLGASVLAISPQTPAHTLATAQKHDLSFELLSDPDNSVARSFGLVYSLPLAFRWVYEKLGIDLADYNGSTRFELPVPATYGVVEDRSIVYAFVQPDYTIRPDPQEIVAALEKRRGRK